MALTIFKNTSGLGQKSMDGHAPIMKSGDRMMRVRKPGGSKALAKLIDGLADDEILILDEVFGGDSRYRLLPQQWKDESNILVLDIDKGEVSPEMIAGKIGKDFAFVATSSGSWERGGEMKSHLFVPLSAPLLRETRYKLAQMIAAAYELGEIDEKIYTPGRLLFETRVKGAVREKIIIVGEASKKFDITPGSKHLEELRRRLVHTRTTPAIRPTSSTPGQYPRHEIVVPGHLIIKPRGWKNKTTLNELLKEIEYDARCGKTIRAHSFDIQSPGRPWHLEQGKYKARLNVWWDRERNRLAYEIIDHRHGARFDVMLQPGMLKQARQYKYTEVWYRYREWEESQAKEKGGKYAERTQLQNLTLPTR